MLRSDPLLETMVILLRDESNRRSSNGADARDGDVSIVQEGERRPRVESCPAGEAEVALRRHRRDPAPIRVRPGIGETHLRLPRPRRCFACRAFRPQGSAQLRRSTFSCTSRVSSPTLSLITRRCAAASRRQGTRVPAPAAYSTGGRTLCRTGRRAGYGRSSARHRGTR